MRVKISWWGQRKKEERKEYEYELPEGKKSIYADEDNNHSNKGGTTEDNKKIQRWLERKINLKKEEAKEGCRNWNLRGKRKIERPKVRR